MKRIQVCHEMPKALFPVAREINDYDYYLDYLWEDKDYCKFFEESLAKGRKVIMDSSLYEFHPIVPPISRFYEHLKYFEKFGKNIEYIVTDVLNDAEKTIANFKDWMYNYRGKCPGKNIGVAQGSTVQELRDCYLFMVKHADKVAIPFDSAAFNELVSEEESSDQLERWALGRQRFIRDLVTDNLWNDKVPCHLLGCSYAWEFSCPVYKRINIESLDTSSPIVCGIKGIRYTSSGNDQKPSVKLCDLIDYEVTEEEKKLINFNIKKFRHIVDTIEEEIIIV